MAGVFKLDVDKLQRQALRRGLSINELIVAAGISYQVISRAKRGQMSEPRTVIKLARALECDPLDIVKE